MAITVTKQTIHDGARNLIVKVHLLGDTNEATALLLIDVSSYAGSPDNVKVTRIVASLENFHATLL